MRVFKHDRGVTTSETLVMMPVFFVMVFGLLQLGQLAVALLVSNYAASSIARRAVKDNSLSGNHTSRLQELMTVGMRNGQVEVRPDSDSAAGLLKNIKVHACADLHAFPFVGQFFGGVLSSQLGPNKGGCSGIQGSFAFNNSAPARFIVHGKATARMNYRS